MSNRETRANTAHDDSWIINPTQTDAFYQAAKQIVNQYPITLESNTPSSIVQAAQRIISAKLNHESGHLFTCSCAQCQRTIWQQGWDQWYQPLPPTPLMDDRNDDDILQLYHHLHSLAQLDPSQAIMQIESYYAQQVTQPWQEPQKDLSQIPANQLSEQQRQDELKRLTHEQLLDDLESKTRTNLTKGYTVWHHY